MDVFPLVPVGKGKAPHQKDFILVSVSFLRYFFFRYISIRLLSYGINTTYSELPVPGS